MADTSEVPALHPHLENVNSLVSENPECLAQGDPAVKDAALAATKYLYALSVESEKGSISHINELLSSLQPSQTRSQGKRKRSPTPTKNVALSPTPLDSLYTESMDDNQIWAQLELRVKSMCDALSFILEDKPEDVDDLPSGSEDDSEDEDFTGMDMDEDDDDSEEDDSFDDEDDGSDEEDEDEELDGDEGELGLRDESEDESDEEPTTRASSSKRKNKNKKHPELDDDFFSLDTFNAETERAEARSSSRGKLGDDDDDSDFEDEEIDLFAPLDSDIDEEEDSQEPMYSDFFDPLPNTGKPSKAKGKSKKGAPEPSGRVRFNDSVKYKVMRHDENSNSDDEEATSSKTSTKSKKRKLPDLEDPEFGFDDFDEEFGEIDDEQFASEGGESSEEGSFDMNDEESDDASDEGADTRATMQRFQEDLFADEDEENHDEEGLSMHQRRQAELRKQIAELEAENVGPKDWTLMGEANSRTRPQNSLLEEDLDFERRAKVTPTITEETVQDLEERIKARIIEGRFDDVVRLRRVEDKPFLPSQMIELKDTKSNQSLAQLYENDFVAAQGGPLAEDRDGKLKKEHDEIEKLWERLCGKLDALCNAHFTPKQPKAVIETISNVSTTSLESALPTTKSATTMLAPEEVYAPSSSAPVARSEMTPAQKRALRGKERKQKKKARDTLEKQLESEGRPRKSKGAKQDKKDALQNIVKAGKGVTVIGKDSKKKTAAKK